MTWKPLELFMNPAKETEIMMPSEERASVVYKARKLLRNRITVRKLDLGKDSQDVLSGARSTTR
jgi:hypothetical protein